MQTLFIIVPAFVVLLTLGVTMFAAGAALDARAQNRARARADAEE